MKIAISYSVLDEFWAYFSPKGLISLVSKTPTYALECIVAGSDEVLEEVKAWKNRGVYIF